MASALRPAIFRQACNAQRLFATSASPITNARPILTSFTKPAFQQTTARVAAFHVTSRRNILPPLPQRIDGTANEAAPVPQPNSAHGGYHWAFERIVSVALIPLTIAPFAAGSVNPTLDAVFCALLVAHSHVGFQSCIIDYFPKKRVPKTRTALEWALRFATLGTLIGLYEFETNDVGLVEGVKRVWKGYVPVTTQTPLGPLDKMLS